MFRKSASLLIAAMAVAALPSTASAFCQSCYVPPPQPCTTCYQLQSVPPQYRTVQETVMVSPGSVVAHRSPAQYRTIMVPKTVMVAPESVAYERIPPRYATRQRVEMVSPGYSYYAPVAPRSRPAATNRIDFGHQAVTGFSGGGLLRQNGCIDSVPNTTAAMKASEL